MESEYTKQANDFMEKTGTTMKATYVKHDRYFADDKESRDIYRITLKRNGDKYTFRFGQSIVNSNGDTPPTPYDVLASITKNDPESFENFCSEYGYDTDSRKALKAFHAVEKEWENVDRLFNDVINELQDIN
jgi:hypothetical protein